MTKEFEGYLDHVSGVLLQTLSIEKSTLPDGSIEQVEMVERSPKGKTKVWKIKFLKDKGTWKVAEVSHGKR